MIYVPFIEKFPKIAETETRIFAIIESGSSLKSQYGLFEAFCNDPKCDCQSVLFNVIDVSTGKALAVIRFGWKNQDFYFKQTGLNSRHLPEELKGPDLNTASVQSEHAPELLEHIKDILTDKSYIGRIIRHYKMFKELIQNEAKHKKLY